MPLDPVAQGDQHVPAHNEERETINALELELEKKISLPPGAATGDLLTWDGTRWITTETRFFEGVGRPDGKFAAPVGSRYIDKAGEQGAIEWVKRTGGSGNTGWLVLAGDTGRRDISSLMSKPAGAAVNAAHVRRVGQVVDMYFDLKMPTGASVTWNPIAVLPGFGPGYSRLGALTAYAGNACSGTALDNDGGIFFYGTVAGRQDRFTATFITGEAWPTSLPGVAF